MKTYLSITALLVAAFMGFCVLAPTVFGGSVSTVEVLLAFALLFAGFYANTAVAFPESSPGLLVHCVAFLSSAALWFVLFWVGFFVLSGIYSP